MREIKFRAFQKSKNKMLDWDELSNHPYLRDVLYREYLEDVMQFTGLKDSEFPALNYD